MKTVKLLRMVLVLTLIQDAYASADALTKKYHKCIDSTSTNAEWSECGAAEIDRQEVRLSRAWKSAFTCFSKSDFNNIETQKAKRKFLESQRLWITWKDQACSFYFPEEGAAPFGREGEVLNAPSCKAEIVSQRAEFLENFAMGC